MADAKGTQWLTELVNRKLGTNYSGYQIRIILRKLIKDGTIEREEGHYVFTGERDERVVAILRAIKAGATADNKQPKAEKPAAAKGRSRKAAAEPEPEDDEEDEVPAPKPRRTRKAAAAEAPAKPARTRRKAPEVLEDDDDDLDLDEL